MRHLVKFDVVPGIYTYVCNILAFSGVCTIENIHTPFDVMCKLHTDSRFSYTLFSYMYLIRHTSVIISDLLNKDLKRMPLVYVLTFRKFSEIGIERHHSVRSTEIKSVIHTPVDLSNFPRRMKETL